MAGKMDKKDKDLLAALAQGKIDRREFFKRVGAAAALVGAGTPFLTSCGDGETTGGNQARTQGSTATVKADGDPLVTLYTTKADEYFTSHAAGTRQCAEALGLKYEEFTNENKPERQLSDFETVAGRGVRMVTVIPPDEANIPRLLECANRYQVHTVTSAEMPAWFFPFTQGPYAVSHVTPNDFDSYYDVSRVLLNHLGGKGKVLMLTGFPGGTPDRLRTAAAQKAIGENPGIKLLGSLPGKWNRVDGRKAMEDLMTANPEFDAVLCLNDEMAIGALAALDDAGKKNIPLIGHNGTTEIMSFINSGRVLATASTFPFWIGAYMVALAYDATRGWKPSIGERLMVSRHAVIDKSNVEIYIRKFVEKIGDLPFDFKRMCKTINPDTWDPQNLVQPMNVNEYFRLSAKPANFEMPKEWQEAMNSGEIENVTRLYAEHYQKKILEEGSTA